MANSKITSEFERLIAFIQTENNNTANKFRIKQLSNVLNILKKYPEKIIAKNETFGCRSRAMWYYHLSAETNTLQTI